MGALNSAEINVEVMAMSKIENDRAITYVNFRKEAKYHYGVKQEEFGKMTECLDPSKMAKHKTLRSEWRRPGTWLLIREGGL